MFVRSVDGNIRLEGAEVSKPAPGRPPENGGINYNGAWQGRRVAMDSVLPGASCVAAAQADDGSCVLFPLAQ
ncbi:MAG: hypothetical protein SOY30_07595 [Eubacteriales bacterium]|nr:hypothetical protein [Eubacteriales bacterium]